MKIHELKQPPEEQYFEVTDNLKPGRPDSYQNRRDHITEALIDMYWLKIEERIVYKTI